MILLLLKALVGIGSLWFLIVYAKSKKGWVSEVALDILAFSSLLFCISVLSLALDFELIDHPTIPTLFLWAFATFAVWNRLFAFYRVRKKSTALSRPSRRRDD